MLRAERPDVVLVPGDVNSTLAAALCAARLEIPIGHVESGLRSFDRTMPEEINRVVADHLSELLFLHSPEAEDNLRAEGVPEDRYQFVGNTMIDTLVALEDRFRARPAAQRGRDASPASTCSSPCTARRSSTARCSPTRSRPSTRSPRDLPVLFPVHPRTRKMLGADGAGAVTLTDPVGYLDFLSLEADAAAVLTDSGGIQEETTYLGIPCFTLRDNTERPVTVRAGTNTLLGLAPERIAEIPALLEAAPAERPQPPEKWDGHAAHRVAEVLADW